MYQKFGTLYTAESIEYYLPVADGDRVDWRTTYPIDVRIEESPVHGATVVATGRHEFIFTYFALGVSIFLLCFLLEDVKLELGFALGLFAVFGILSVPAAEILSTLLALGLLFNMLRIR